MTEVKNLKNFRGNILDRQFPVQFDPKTGLYSYDYVEKNSDTAAKLKALKYYRKSSKNLKEIEDDLAKYLKTQVSAPPPVKSEITKAAEAEEAKLKSVQEILNTSVKKAVSGEPLTRAELQVTQEAQKERIKLERPVKYKYAQDMLEKIYSQYNEKLARGEPVNIDPVTKRAKLTAANQATADQFLQIIKASDQLEAYDNKVKSGETLSPAEKAIQANSERIINSFVDMPEPEMNRNIAANINAKAKYNEARATVSQLKNKKNLNLTARNKLSRAEANVAKYESEHTNQQIRATEQRTLQLVELKRKRIKELNAKPAPLSPEDQAEKTRLQAVVNAYNAAALLRKPQATKESANLQVTGSKNIFEEPAQYEKPKENSDVQGTSPERELSNEAFQARQGKAQRVLNYFSSAAAPARLSNEQTKLRNNAQRIIQAFAKIANTSAKPANQNAARKTIKNSNFLNQARKLSIATGGKRRTRKARRSGGKTYKRRQ